MKLYFLGTCAGTEPMPDRKHASFVLESNDRLYWFDAGESCSYTAYNMGLDLLAVTNIVISHPHMDHVGGLGNLLWNFRKLYYVKNKLPYHGAINLYIPNLETFEGIMMILRNSEGGFQSPVELNTHKTHDGVLIDDGYVKVTALHNQHIPAPEGAWQSYSFLIECEGKRIVYSGDVRTYDELDPLIGDGCNALILETGHFNIDDAYAYVKGKAVQKLYFTHNGREFLHFPKESAEKVQALFGDTAAICYDKMVETL